jgi:carbon storage regulator
MLVLSRKVGERVEIGDGITLVVVASNGRKVRLGFEAPDEVTIRREELVAVCGARGIRRRGTAQRNDSATFRSTEKSR